LAFATARFSEPAAAISTGRPATGCCVCAWPRRDEERQRGDRLGRRRWHAAAPSSTAGDRGLENWISWPGPAGPQLPGRPRDTERLLVAAQARLRTRTDSTTFEPASSPRWPR
jgi:hypothetical protein